MGGSDKGRQIRIVRALGQNGQQPTAYPCQVGDQQFGRSLSALRRGGRGSR